MDDKLHEMVSRIKDLALELGRSPTKHEGLGSGISDYAIKRAGGWMTLLQASGLDQNVSKRKINNTIFEKNIEKHLEEFVPSEKPEAPFSFSRTVIIGDTHFPFVHQPTLEKIYKLIEDFKPERVIQIGDLYDMFSHGKFPRSMNVYTPKDEMNEGRKCAEAMWSKIKQIVPAAELHQCLGNHDIRPIKRVIEQYPEAELFFDFEKWFKFSGVEIHMDVRKELILDGIVYIHGYKSKLGEHMDFIRRPTVCGHSHRGGVHFKNFGDVILWELNAGYVGDPSSKALSYTPQQHTHWTHGVGIIDHLGPRFVAL